jgi:hypothetical protein
VGRKEEISTRTKVVRGSYKPIVAADYRTVQGQYLTGAWRTKWCSCFGILFFTYFLARIKIDVDVDWMEDGEDLEGWDNWIDKAEEAGVLEYVR